MIQWHFYERVFRRWLVVMIGSREDFKKELEDIGYDERDEINLDGASGMCIELTPQNNPTGQSCCLIYMPQWSTNTLVHEISHLVMFQLDQCNLEQTRHTTEIYAFLTEYWFTEIQRVKRTYPKGRSPAQARK